MFFFSSSLPIHDRLRVRASPPPLGEKVACRRRFLQSFSRRAGRVRGLQGWRYGFCAGAEARRSRHSGRDARVTLSLDTDQPTVHLAYALAGVGQA
jgi:hypothetical protein